MSYTTTYRGLVASTIRKARYGRRDWLMWRDKAGAWHTDLATPAAYKRALLSVGTQGYFYRIAARTAVSHLITWPLGILAMRNAKYR